MNSSSYLVRVACYSILSAICFVGSSCAVVGVRNVTWDGLVISSEGPILGKRYIDPFGFLTYKPEQAAPDFLVVLPDGATINPNKATLREAKAWLTRESTPKPVENSPEVYHRTEYFRDGSKIGRLVTTTYGISSIDDSVVVEVYYQAGRTALHFDKHTGKLTYLTMRYGSTTSKTRVKRPSISDPDTGEILDLPIYLREAERIFGQPNDDSASLFNT